MDDVSTALALRRRTARAVGADPLDPLPHTRLRQWWRSYSLPLTMRIGTGQPKLRVELGDVTSDGRRDILVSQYSGNHGCGPHRVIATVAGRPRLIFRAHVCETQLEARRGQLEISDGFYEPGDSVCCPSFIRVTTKRWTGRRLVTASTRLIPQRYR
jgi:hypothetical protein